MRQALSCVVLGAALLLAVGCSGDDGDSSADTATDSGAVDSSTLLPEVAQPDVPPSINDGCAKSVDDEYNKCTLTSKEAQGALQWLLDLTFEHEVMPPPGSFEGQDNPFLTGNVGISYGGTWFESQIRDAGLNWDFVRQPVHPDTGKRSVQLGSNAWSILANTTQREGAWQVVKHLMGEVGQTYMMNYGLPGLKSVINSQAYLDAHRPQTVERLIADFECCPHDYYPTADTDEWWSALSNELSVVWSGEATVEEATEATCKAADEIFANRPPSYQ